MNRLLIKKTVHESALLFLACATLLVLFCWARVWIVCQFDLQRFEPLLEQLKPFQKFSPVPLEQFLTYGGSLAMTFHEPVLILSILVWSIARGSDVVSGELNRGTLEMLLAQPVSRLQWLGCHLLVCTLGLFALCTVACSALAAGIHTQSVPQQVSSTIDVAIPGTSWSIPIRLGESQSVDTPLSQLVDAGQYVAPSLNLFGFGFFILGLSVFCSSCDRYRWRTIGIVIGCYVGQLLVYLLSKATPAYESLGYFTFLSAYRPEAMVYMSSADPTYAWLFYVPPAMRTSVWNSWLGPLGMTCLLIMGGVFWVLLAAQRLRTRDLPAPL